jgi:AAA ATPase domain
MSEQLLHELVAREALRPPVDWRGFAEAHVRFDELNATDEYEQRLLREVARDAGSSLVLGISGSGKSSLIAAVAESASPARWVVRVQGDATADLLHRAGFARHIAHEATRALTHDQLAPRIRAKETEKYLADSRKAVSGGHQFGAKFAQVKSAVEEVVSSQQPSDLFAALDELAEVSADAGRRMLLVVEDTDVFMPPTDVGVPDAEERASQFISQVLPFLARELRCPSLVAVNSRYRKLVDQQLGGTVTTVAVPPFRDPGRALTRIMERQALRKGLHLTEKIIDDDALAWLASALAEGQSLRTVLRGVFDAATRTARDEPTASRISLAAVLSTL